MLPNSSYRCDEEQPYSKAFYLLAVGLEEKEERGKRLM
jgi:hypothetical protein